ncbi:hypothetical protein HPP92_012075 [Vanilla planifolia]|uniref:Uncharacterized protein n=1 Tax=Vanilla planifolia TaxID=51239 RepID=A0A835R793_VANPL|nr:hypothetical protein HPP92_012075 [Vanilla planifolia]
MEKKRILNSKDNSSSIQSSREDRSLLITTEGELRRGTWSDAEDRKLAECIDKHGPKNWKLVTQTSGLRKCSKSCQMRWMSHLQSNVKKRSFSEDEERIIFTLHKLLATNGLKLPGL